MKKNIFNIIGFSFIFVAFTGIVNLYADELHMMDKLERHRYNKNNFLNRLQSNTSNKTDTASMNRDIMYRIQTKRISSNMNNNSAECYKQTEYSEFNDIGISDLIKSANSKSLLGLLGFDGTVNIINIGINAPAPYLRTFKMRINRLDIDM